MIGVIALHAEAPRGFSEDDAAFVIHSASLVAGAIENARLYEAHAPPRARAGAALGALGPRSRAADHARRAAARRRPRPLRPAARRQVRVYAVEPGDRLRRRAARAPTRRRPRPRRACSSCGAARDRRRRRRRAGERARRAPRSRCRSRSTARLLGSSWSRCGRRSRSTPTSSTCSALGRRPDGGRAARRSS